jgi:hypothetical protein
MAINVVHKLVSDIAEADIPERRHSNAFSIIINPNLGSTPLYDSQDSIIISSNAVIDEVLISAVTQLALRTAIVVALPQLHGCSPCVNDLIELRAVNNNNVDMRGAAIDEKLSLPHGAAPAAEERYVGRCDMFPREVVVDGSICRGQELLRTSGKQIPVLGDASVRVWQGALDAE